MPRGVRKRVNYEEELKEIERKIAKHKMQIAALESRQKDITVLQDKAQMDSLMKLMEEKGMSIDDLISTLETDAED